MPITLYQLAQRYVGIHELIKGNHPLIQWWLSLCGFPTNVADEIPWCSAFVNGMAWELRLPRSKSAAARSWLNVGIPIQLGQATPAWDIVILSRGNNPAQGHVGLFAGYTNGNTIQILGGNQSDAVCIEEFPVGRLLGIRRLYGEANG